MLTQMANTLLKSADQADAFAKSKERNQKIKSLHEAISEKYKFYTSRGYSTDETKRDADTLKILEKKLTLNNQENDKLDRLFFKYGI